MPTLENRIWLANTHLVAGQSATVNLPSGYAGQYAAGFLYSTPTGLGGWKLVSVGNTIQIQVPLAVTNGAHRLAVQDASGAVIGWTRVTVSGGLASTGVDGDGLQGAIGAPVLLLGAGAMLLWGARRRAVVRRG